MSDEVSAVGAADQILAARKRFGPALHASGFRYVCGEGSDVEGDEAAERFDVACVGCVAQIVADMTLDGEMSIPRPVTFDDAEYMSPSLSFATAQAVLIALSR